MINYLDIDVADLNLSYHTKKLLRNNHIYKVRQLVAFKRSDLLNIKTFGEQSLRAVEEALNIYRLHLNMSKDEIDKAEMHLDRYLSEITVRELINILDSRYGK